MTLPAMKELMGDDRVWAMAARVALHDGETSHFDVSDEGHIMLSVRTLRHDAPVTALLKGGDDNGAGVWFVPAIGTEVIINFDDGMYEGDAYVVAIVGEKPGTLDVQPGVLYLVNDTIEARSVGGVAQSLAFQTKLNALESKVNSLIAKHNTHVHVISGAPPVTAVTAVLETVILSSTGTQVFKGE